MRYKELYEKDLQKLLKSECGKRNFGTAVSKTLLVDTQKSERDVYGRRKARCRCASSTSQKPMRLLDLAKAAASPRRYQHASSHPLIP
jgi:hypothetical protein